MSRSAKQNEYLARLISFTLYWDSVLSTRLKNSELIRNFSNKKNCKNDALSELLGWYSDSTISLALVEIYEAAQMALQAGSSFQYDLKDEADPVGRVISYRNKLVTHREVTKGTEEGDRVRDLVKETQGKVYRDIELAVESIIEWLDDQDHCGGSYASRVTVPITDATLSDLIKNAPIFEYYPS